MNRRGQHGRVCGRCRSQPVHRSQCTLFPAVLEDYVGDDNPVRAVDAFVDGLNLGKLGFASAQALDVGRPGYAPATMLKIYIYGYLNRIPSSRRLERECQRNIELIWLTGRLAPDFKTIADFRRDNGKAIGETCRAFVALCRKLNLLSEASVAIDGSKFVLAEPSFAWTPSTHATRISPKAKWRAGSNVSTRASRATCRSSKPQIGKPRVALTCRRQRSRG